MKPRKKLGAVLFGSIFFPGIGQVYNGEIRKGIAVYLVTVIGFFIFVVPGVLAWIYGIYESYTTAKTMNAGKIPYAQPGLNYIFGFMGMQILGYFVIVILAGTVLEFINPVRMIFG